jgi:hypothetical protein
MSVGEKLAAIIVWPIIFGFISLMSWRKYLRTDDDVFLSMAVMGAVVAGAYVVIGAVFLFARHGPATRQ